MDFKMPMFITMDNVLLTNSMLDKNWVVTFIYNNVCFVFKTLLYIAGEWGSVIFAGLVLLALLLNDYKMYEMNNQFNKIIEYLEKDIHLIRKINIQRENDIETVLIHNALKIKEYCNMNEKRMVVIEEMMNRAYF